MPAKNEPATFSSPVVAAEDGTFMYAMVPAEISKTHLRRGRITARMTVGNSRFDALMEPDGNLGHWFVVPQHVVETEALTKREDASFVLTTLREQPEPALPEAFKTLLAQHPLAQATWDSASTLARIDWVHWMESAKQASTRHERAVAAIDMLEQGKKRVCCFDPSGVYSKALTRP